MRKLLRNALIAAGLGLALISSAAFADDIASDVFGAASAPTDGHSASVGSYARGCLAGAVQLPADGPGWSAMRLERERRWGHSEMIAFIRRLAAGAQSIGLNGILVGDLGQVRGGPMRSGHRSHQIGLDADIWLRPLGTQPPTPAERRDLSSYDVVQGRHTLNEDLWRRSSASAIMIAAADPVVARIFVHPVIKRELCHNVTGAARTWLKKVRPWWGHDSHFHVRLACPPGSPDCEAQNPVSEGDGCGDELSWWFTDEPYSGASVPRDPLTMDDLPLACSAVSGSR